MADILFLSTDQSKLLDFPYILCYTYDDAAVDSHYRIGIEYCCVILTRSSDSEYPLFRSTYTHRIPLYTTSICMHATPPVHFHINIYAHPNIQRILILQYMVILLRLCHRTRFSIYVYTTPPKITLYIPLTTYTPTAYPINTSLLQQRV